MQLCLLHEFPKKGEVFVVVTHVPPWRFLENDNCKSKCFLWLPKAGGEVWGGWEQTASSHTWSCTVSCEIVKFPLVNSLSDDQDKSRAVNSVVFMQCFPWSVNRRSLFHSPSAKLVFGWSLADEYNRLDGKIRNIGKTFSFSTNHHHLTILQTPDFPFNLKCVENCMEDSTLKCAGTGSSFGRENSLETCSLFTITTGSVRLLQLQYLEFYFPLFPMVTESFGPYLNQKPLKDELKVRWPQCSLCSVFFQGPAGQRFHRDPLPAGRHRRGSHAQPHGKGGVPRVGDASSSKSTVFSARIWALGSNSSTCDPFFFTVTFSVFVAALILHVSF